MSTRPSLPAPLWLRRLLVVGGLVLGAWLAGSVASADTGTADLAHRLIQEAKSGQDIGDLVDGAISDGAISDGPADPDQTTPAPDAPDPDEPGAPGDVPPVDFPVAPDRPEPDESSDAEGSAGSTPGEVRENTTTRGGVDYGPGEITDPARPDGTGTAADRPAAPAPPSTPEPAPTRAAAPAPTATDRVDAVAPRAAPIPAATPRRAADAPAAAPTTAPAERPVDTPLPPAPTAPGSGTTAGPGSAHDGGSPARGALGVLATRAHAAPPSGGWSVGLPQVHGRAVAAADAPGARPD